MFARIIVGMVLGLSLSAAATDFQSLRVEDGTLVFEDGREAVFWGVNLQPSLSWEYNRMKRHGLHVPLEMPAYKAMIDEAYDELEMMGCDLIRIHLSPGDITDRDGNLVENRWLELTDYVMAEAEKRGMYTYLAFLNTLGVDRGGDTFVSRKDETKPMWMVDPAFIEKSDRFIHQLLNRANPYLEGAKYKDSPALALVEPINEPGYFTRETLADFPACLEVYENWLRDQARMDDAESFSAWRVANSKAYINRMVRFFKDEGLAAPMVWSMEWPRMMEWTGEDVFVAAAESDAPVVSVCFYPGQSSAYGKSGEELKAVGEANHFEYIRQSYEFREWHGWLREDRFRDKARVVYEFETYYNQNAHLYPLMAKYFRAQGMQAAAMWTYLLPGQAEYTAAAHHLNLKTTPNKAAAFIAAGEVMRNTPRYAPYETTSAVDDFTDHLALSHERGSSAYVDEETLMYTDGMPEEYIENLSPNLASLRRVVGRGHSPAADYAGTGLYFIERIDESTITLTILPEAAFVVPHYLPNDAGTRAVELSDDIERAFTLRLSDCSKVSRVTRLENDARKAVDHFYENGLRFNARPGTYVIEIESGEE